MRYDKIIKALEEQFEFSNCKTEQKTLLNTLKFYYKKRMKANLNPIEMTFSSCINKH